MDLNGKTAIVTGAGTGVGQQLAIAFASAGANVVCCGRREQKLHETISKIGKGAGQDISVPLDVTKWADVQKMVEKAHRTFGGIDVLFNNAGSFRFVGPVWDADPVLWWKDVEINLLGSMLCCRAVLPHMIRKGSGIIISMDGGGGSMGPNVGGSAYGCSKAAIVRFMEGLARELEREKYPVLAFVMNPGFVRSEMTEGLVDAPQKRKWQPHVVDLFESHTEVPADACAKATMKLLDIASPELNGRIFYVDTDYEQVRLNKVRIRNENLLVLRRVDLD
jgi:NAD(P)-dependent dehydrogenase (short-subunit alcohol dehydrogenase family)